MRVRSVKQLLRSASPTRFLIAPDKFKGTLSARQAAHAIAQALKAVNPTCRCTLAPLSDGGDGFVETLCGAAGGKIHWMCTTDPIGRKRMACWGDLGRDAHGRRTAVVGLTESSALAYLAPGQRNPLQTSNEGCGRILAKVVQLGFDRVIVGIGGSATTEGGIGLLAPLGFRFLDRNRNPIPLTGEGLSKLARIELPRHKIKAEFLIASDVTNPLYGPRGAAVVFGPQKGATPRMVKTLDNNLRLLAHITKKTLGRSPHMKPGAGAAGGCGYGLLAFLNSRIIPGFDLIAQVLELRKKIRNHDVIITGEGCLDKTSLDGKAPVRLARMARQYDKPVWAICGKTRNLAPSDTLPFSKVVSLVTDDTTCEQTMKHPQRYLRSLVKQTAHEYFDAARLSRRNGAHYPFASLIASV
jgi:glycerate kinase